MDAARKPALGDATNASPPPAAKPPPRPAADKPPRAVVTWYHLDQLPPPPAAELLRPAPPAAPPKESSSAFVFFGRANREDIKAAHPDWSLGDVGRELSKRWKALDDAAKKTFHDLAAADKERYESEKAAYEAENPPVPVVAENDVPPPRKPPKRKAPPTKTVALPETEDWKPENGGVRIVNAWTGEPLRPKPCAKKVYCSDDDSEIEDDDEPKMKKQTGYLHFCAQNREAAKAAVAAAEPDLPAGEANKAVMTKLGEMWGALDAAAKQKCADDAPMVAVKPKKKKAKVAAEPAKKPAANAKADRDAAAKAKAERDAIVAKAKAERDTATLAKLAEAEAAAQGDRTYCPARDRFLEKGLDPVAPSRGRYAGVALTKADMLSMVDARVAAKKTKAAKGAEWLDGMRKDASFWIKVKSYCRPQEDRKKKGDKVAGSRAGGAKRGSQKGQAAAKKARTA